MILKKQSEDVWIADDKKIILRRDDLNLLKKLVDKTKRKRIRICIHKKSEDLIHEMFIVNRKDTYIRPHKHLRKKESYIIIEGSTDIIQYDEKGAITDIEPLGDFQSGKNFYFKLDKPVYHSMIVSSDKLVFIEVTNGPFDKKDTLFSPWSPAEEDTEAVIKFMGNLQKSLLNREKK